MLNKYKCFNLFVFVFSPGMPFSSQFCGERTFISAVLSAVSDVSGSCFGASAADAVKSRSTSGRIRTSLFQRRHASGIYYPPLD